MLWSPLSCLILEDHLKTSFSSELSSMAMNYFCYHATCLAIGYQLLSMCFSSWWIITYKGFRGLVQKPQHVHDLLFVGGTGQTLAVIDETHSFFIHGTSWNFLLLFICLRSSLISSMMLLFTPVFEGIFFSWIFCYSFENCGAVVLLF